MEDSIDDTLSRALDLASRGDLSQARDVVAAFSREQRRRDRERSAAMSRSRHEIGNALSIAQASIEAMLDGVVGITDARLTRIRDILASVSESMYALTSDIPPALPQTDVAAVAQAKNVTLSYEGTLQDDGAAQQKLRTVVLAAVRYTPPGGNVRIASSAGGEFLINVCSESAANVLKASGDSARLLDDDGSRASVIICDR